MNSNIPSNDIVKSLRINKLDSLHDHYIQRYCLTYVSKIVEGRYKLLTSNNSKVTDIKRSDKN